MMLSELTELQDSDDGERVWGEPTVSFEIDTRTSNDEWLVNKTYVFSYAREWQKWCFSEFIEKRTRNTEHISDRNWNRTEHVLWQEGDSRDIDVPPEVTRKLQDLLSMEEIELSML